MTLKGYELRARSKHSLLFFAFNLFGIGLIFEGIPATNNIMFGYIIAGLSLMICFSWHELKDKSMIDKVIENKDYKPKGKYEK